MILKSVLQARAGRGYRWLQEYGPRYDLDVNRLHEANGHPVTYLDASSAYACPLAFCNFGANWSVGSPYSQVIARLRLSGSTLPEFLTSHGFDIWPGGGPIGQFVGIWVFNVGGDRDFRALNQAWRNVIAANATGLDD
jgi:hypothetical protein